ncbi:MAG: hypothetical protein KA142_05055 [Chromatiaceae bacterium]|nr:hypothetical protein [Chromatiaceae bacterium]MBP8282648.1 hypothetical protein [Chromatiaceae bacterium]
MNCADFCNFDKHIWTRYCYKYMTGIAGIIHFDGKPVEPGLIDKMTSAMAHRGPDGVNHWVKGSVALGQCMLRTTPKLLEQHQPLTNEDESLVLVMDGRVCNRKQLRWKSPTARQPGACGSGGGGVRGWYKRSGCRRFPA